MEQHLRSEYHAAAAGGRLYAFVNAMHAAGICCKKQRCEENIYQFRFYAKHRKAVEQLAQTYHVQLTLTPRKTYPYCNYGRPGTKYEELAEYRMKNHDL